MLGFSTSSFLASTAIFLALSSVSLARPPTRASLLEQGQILQAPRDVDFVPGWYLLQRPCRTPISQNTIQNLDGGGDSVRPQRNSPKPSTASSVSSGAVSPAGRSRRRADSFVDSCNSDPTGAFILGGVTLNSGSDSGKRRRRHGERPGPSASGSGQTSATPAATGGASTGDGAGDDKDKSNAGSVWSRLPEQLRWAS
ncbi:hypothetical protein B0H14DRAFT_3899755 [Mycena olivaceomarginata]|nr:hypothetical protein B0H14DRAFT_3899755 [Mycena olivaceomarginata]